MNKQIKKWAAAPVTMLAALLLMPLTAFAATPAAPTNLSLARSGQHVVLTWTDNSSNETRFSIYRKLYNTSDGWTPVGTVPANTTTFTDTSTTEGVTYAYMVQAYSSVDGYSERSNQPAITTIPFAPSGFTATAGASGITLKWTNHSANAPKTQIQRRPDGAGAWRHITDVALPSNSYVDTAVEPGKTYEYRIFALSAGTGSADLYATATMPAPATPPKETPPEIKQTPIKEMPDPTDPVDSTDPVDIVDIVAEPEEKLEITELGGVTKPRENNDFNWLWIVFGALAAMSIVSGAIFFIMLRKNAQKPETEPTIT